MRAWVSLAALFALVSALGAWVYYRPTTTPAETHGLSALRPSDVKRVRLARAPPDTRAQEHERGGSVTSSAPALIVLDRQNDEWLITTPLVARAEKSQVERMLSILDARSSVRYPASDLIRYGLSEPQATLTLEDQTFSYGAINNMTREQYVLTRDAVYAVPLAYVTALPRSADALLSLRLFARDEAPVRFELPDFSVSLRDGTWTVAGRADDASPDDRHAWVDAWRNASAMRAARSDEPTPPQEIKVQLKDGRTMTFGIMQRESDLVLLRRDESVAYHLPAGSGKRLMSPPGAVRKSPSNAQ